MILALLGAFQGMTFIPMDFDLARFADQARLVAPASIVPPCSLAGDADIVVCGRRGSDGVRLPLYDGAPEEGTREWMTVAHERYQLFNHGGSGIGSCSTVGPGGMTGCLTQGFREHELQYPGSGVSF